MKRGDWGEELGPFDQMTIIGPGLGLSGCVEAWLGVYICWNSADMSGRICPV